jgi:two-component system, sensor histidine kinase and response regulator
MENKPKILLVDDRIENLIALETVLADMDVELVKATSGNEALKHTLHHDFALALIDIQMPGMDGYELASILREEEKTTNLPFIFISGVYTDNLNVFKGYEKGAFSFITKPFQPEILINKVKLFVDHYRNEYMLKSLNESLQEKNLELGLVNKELESFTYSVSHDLRAPLRSIDGYARVLFEDYYEKIDDDGKKSLERIKNNAQMMGRLIDDLLDFSKVGRKELNKDLVNMNDIVNTVIGELQEQMKNRDIEFKISDLHTQMADINLLKQVWINLISNAIKYTRKREKTIIEIGSSNGLQPIYHIKDNGAGFDMLYVNKLFGVFQRLHKEKDFEGTGVGLAIVQRIISKHGGSIWAEAEVDKGATFYFSLSKHKQTIS